MFSKLALVALVAAAGVSAHQDLITPNAANGNYDLPAGNIATCDNWVEPATTGSWGVTPDQMVSFTTDIVVAHGGGTFSVGVWVSGSTTGNMTFTTGTPATVTGGMMYPNATSQISWGINATLPSAIGSRGVIQLGMITADAGAADYYQCVYYTDATPAPSPSPSPAPSSTPSPSPSPSSSASTLAASALLAGAALAAF